MLVLWDRGESSVADVVDAIGDPPLAYNTVLTTMRILEEKGFLRHTKSKEGRAFLYRAVVGRDDGRTPNPAYVAGLTRRPVRTSSATSGLASAALRVSCASRATVSVTLTPCSSASSLARRSNADSSWRR